MSSLMGIVRKKDNFKITVILLHIHVQLSFQFENWSNEPQLNDVWRGKRPLCSYYGLIVGNGARDFCYQNNHIKQPSSEACRPQTVHIIDSHYGIEMM